MGIAATFRRWIRPPRSLKALSLTNEERFWHPAQDWFPASRSGVNVGPESAMRVAACYACVRVLAETLAQLPVHVYERLPNNRKRLVDNHPMNFITLTPNEWQTWFEFVEYQMGNLGFRGNAYAERLAGPRGATTRLRPIRADRMTVEKLTNGRLRYTYRDPKTGEATEYNQEEIFHVRAPALSGDGMTGISPVQAAREALGLAIATEAHGATFFGNGARPGFVFASDQPIKSDAAKQFLHDWNTNHGGAFNSHHPGVLPWGLKPVEIGMTNEDSQFLDTRRFQVEEIARIYRVPLHMIGDLTRCMPAETLVYTELHGPKRISEIARGTYVWSVGKAGRLEPAKVTNRYENGTRELLEIATTNRTVRCTKTHRLLVRRQRLRPLALGEVGGKNVSGQKMRVEWVNEYVVAGELREGDMVVTLGRLPSGGCTWAPNGRKLSVEFMEFCGLLVGDGNIHRSSKKPSHVSIARGSKANYMDHYRRAARSEFVGYHKNQNYRKPGKTKPVHLYESERATSFASVLAAGELDQLGFSGNAFTKRVPRWVFGSTDDLKLAFLRGFLDADGTVDRKGRLTYYSANRDLLDQVRHLCMGLGIPVTNRRSDVNTKPAPGSKSLVPTRIWRFTCSDPGANRRIGSHDSRYVERLEDAQPFGKKDRNYPRFGGSVGIEGLSSAKIVRIRELPAEPTYDLEVEGNHSFIADGVASHNSTNNNIEHQSLEFVQYTMLPWLRRWEQAISRDLIGEPERFYIKFNVEGLLRGDSTARSAFLREMTNAGLYTINEGREKENLEPIGPNGDVHLVQGAMTTLDLVINPPEPEPAAPAKPALEVPRFSLNGASDDAD